MLTRRIFLRGSAVVMAGMGTAPLWLTRAAAAESRKNKTLVAIFLRGAADGLNIVVPFGDKRYRELRPTLAIAAAHRTKQRQRRTFRPLHRPRWHLRPQRRIAAPESPVGQKTVGDCGCHRIARSHTLG